MLDHRTSNGVQLTGFDQQAINGIGATMLRVTRIGIEDLIKEMLRIPEKCYGESYGGELQHSSAVRDRLLCGVYWGSHTKTGAWQLLSIT